MNYRQKPQSANLYQSAQTIVYVRWNPSYSLGIKQIDDQHKRLLGFVNDLYNHALDDETDKREFFKAIIGQVVDYIKKHFAIEEKVMLATQFPGYYIHKMAHEEFVLTVVKTVKDFEAGKRLVLTNFSNYLRNWILSHIAIVDVKYCDYIKKIAARNTDGKLCVI